jgi:hypothetical protein
MSKNQSDTTIFSITISLIQEEAIKRIGRKLTDDELHIASNGIESGFFSCIDVIIKTAIEDAVRLS